MKFRLLMSTIVLSLFGAGLFGSQVCAVVFLISWLIMFFWGLFGNIYADM
jgi:hypothetical protein